MLIKAEKKKKKKAEFADFNWALTTLETASGLIAPWLDRSTRNLDRSIK